MATFDELIGDGKTPFARLFAAVGDRTYKMSTDSSGRHGVNFMGTFYTDPRQYHQAREALKFRSQHTITGANLESLPSGTGYWNYGREEAAVKRIRNLPGYEDFKLVRTSMGSDLDIKELIKLRVRKGVEHGMMIPDDETTTLIQAFAHGKELPTAELRGLLSREDMISSGNLLQTAGSYTTKAYAKLQKRMKIFGNIDQYHADLGRKTRAFVWDASRDGSIYRSVNKEGAAAIDKMIAEEIAAGQTAMQAKGIFGPVNTEKIAGDAWEKVTSGASLVSPHMIKDVRSKMFSRLRMLENEYKKTAGTMSRAEQDQAMRTISAMKKDIADLKVMTEKGGRLEQFRISGFDKDYLVKMGMDDKKATEIAKSMAKGDAYVVPMGRWDKFLNDVQWHMGLENEQTNLLRKGVDVITSENSIAKEMRSTLGVSFKGTHVREGVRTDPQLLSTYSRELFGAGTSTPYESLISRNAANFESTLKEITETGQLPKGYTRHLNEILGLSADDPDRVEALLGTTNISEMINQQGRARRILLNEELGLHPGNDREMFEDVSSSLMDFMDRTKFGRKHQDLYGFAEASLQGHVGTDFFPGLLGEAEAGLERGSFAVSRTHGIVLNSADFVQFGSEAFGGADLDDLLGAMIRWDEETGDFYGVLKRSPLGLGEITGLKLHHGSIENVARILTGGELPIQQNPELKAALTEIGFYGKEWNAQDPDNIRKMEEALKENIPTLGLKEKEDLKRLGHVFDGTSMSRPVMPSGMDVLTTDSYKATIQEARDTIHYMDLPTKGTLADFFPDDRMLSELSKAEWERLINVNTTKGMLGKYSLVREMADEMTRAAELMKVQGIEGAIKPFAMEPIIDLITQGVAKGYDTMNMADVEVARESLLRGITEAAVAAKDQGHGLLDPQRFDAEFGRNYSNRSSIEKHLLNMESDYTVDDLFMGEGDREAIYSQSKAARSRMVGMMKNTKNKMKAKISEDKVIGRTFFSDKAVADADLMRMAYDEAKRQAPQLSGLPGSMEQLSELGDEVLDTASEEFRSDFASKEMQRVYASFFEEDDTMGRRAVEAMGAFVQRHKASEAGRSVYSGAMADAMVKARSTIALGRENLGLTDAQLVKHQQIASSPLMKEHILQGLDEGFTVPGIHTAKVRQIAYDTATRVKDGLLARGPQNFKAGEAIQKLMGVKGFRNAAIGGAALVGASLLYRKTKDRTVDELAGPPLLPGGSFYEDVGSQPLPPAMGNQNSVEPSGGTAYKIHAQGSFVPSSLMAAAEGMVGASASGAIFKSLSRGTQRKDPRKSFK